MRSTAPSFPSASATERPTGTARRKMVRTRESRAGAEENGSSLDGVELHEGVDVGDVRLPDPRSALGDQAARVALGGAQGGAHEEVYHVDALLHLGPGHRHGRDAGE